MLATAPLASIIVRSYHHAEPIIELVNHLQQQKFPSFEIVIVEQSEDDALCTELNRPADPRVRVIRCRPLGAPGARNEGIRHARGQMLLFIDDDDLPVNGQWIADHMSNYEDPLCMG